jgi:predicted kinase
MRTLTILRGISGAGKSTYTRNNHPNAIVCSADHFFYDADGNYKWDGNKLGYFHKLSLAKCESALQQGADDVVVDNTNAKLREMKPYLKAAEKYGYTVNVVRLVVDPEIAAARNGGRAPAFAVQNQQNRFQDYPGETIIDTTPVAV